MKTTGIEILAYISEQLGVDVLSPRFAYDRLTDVQKDSVVRWVIQRESPSYAVEIVPGAGEWGPELTHLFFSDPFKYLDRLRTVLTRDCATASEMEEMIETEATMQAGMHPHLMRVALWNDHWTFYQIVVDAAINYLNKAIDSAVEEEHARFVQLSA